MNADKRKNKVSRQDARAQRNAIIGRKALESQIPLLVEYSEVPERSGRDNHRLHRLAQM